MMALGRGKAEPDRSGELTRAVQRLFRVWHHAGIKVEKTFVNIPAIPFMYELNKGLLDRLDGAGFAARLAANLALLDRLAGELLGAARRDVPAIDARGFERLPQT